MSRWSLLRAGLYDWVQTHMPNRYLEIPSAVTLIDPATGEPIPEPDDPKKSQSWDFDFVMSKLLSNPMWGESFAGMRSQEAIHDAWKNAKDGIVTIAEEDWVRLKQAVEAPKTTITTQAGAQVVHGFGVHPMLARHLVSLLSPIMDAKAERPKPKAVPVSLEDSEQAARPVTKKPR